MDSRTPRRRYKKTCYFVCRLTDVILSPLIITYIMSVFSSIDASTLRPPCKKYDFFDEGLRSCEPCSQLCDQAEYRDTVDQCRTFCKAYAELLWPPETKHSPSESSESPGPGSQMADSGLPIGATVAIIITAVAVTMLTAAGVYFYRNRQSIALFKRAHTEDSEMAEDIEMQELNRDRNGRGEGGPDRQPSERELLPAGRETEPSDSELEDDTSTETRRNQYGVQEEGRPSIDGAGLHSWQILGRNEEGEVKTDMLRHPSSSSGLPVPVSVTAEGHAAPSQMCALEPSWIVPEHGLTDLHGSSSADPECTDPKMSMHIEPQ